MRYDKKRSLYESIMKDVAKVVKRHLNEYSAADYGVDLYTPLNSVADAVNNIKINDYNVAIKCSYADQQKIIKRLSNELDCRVINGPNISSYGEIKQEINKLLDRCDLIIVKEFDRGDTPFQYGILNNASLAAQDTNTKFVILLNDDIDDYYLSAANVRRFRWYSL